MRVGGGGGEREGGEVCKHYITSMCHRTMNLTLIITLSTLRQYKLCTGRTRADGLTDSKQTITPFHECCPVPRPTRFLESSRSCLYYRPQVTVATPPLDPFTPDTPPSTALHVDYDMLYTQYDTDQLIVLWCYI